MNQKYFTLEQIDEGKPIIARTPDGDIFIKIGDVALTMNAEEFIEFIADCSTVATTLADRP